MRNTVIPRGALLLLYGLLYTLLNAAFLRAAPVAGLSGVMEVGVIAAEPLFGMTGARFMSGLIAFGLLSALSAMVWAGTITDPAKRTIATGTAYQTWKKKDPSAADAALAASGLTAEQQQQARDTKAIPGDSVSGSFLRIHISSPRSF